MIRKNIASYNSGKIIYSHSRFLNPSNEYFLMHSHYEAELLLFVEGSGNYIIDGKYYTLKKNDIIFIGSNYHHFLNLNSDFQNSAENYERYDIMFDLSLLPEQLADNMQQPFFVFSATNKPDIIELFHKMDKYVNQFPREATESLLQGLITEILYNIVFEIDEYYEYQQYLNPTLEKAIQYINDHLNELSDLEEICKAMFISKSYLHKLFKQYLLTTPKQYISQKRLVLARQMLESGEAPKKVCNICGFADYSAFFRSYKKAFGTSPTKDPQKIHREKSDTAY